MKIIFFFAFFSIFLSGCQFIPLFSPIVTGIIIWKDGQANKYYEMDTLVMQRCVKNSLNDLEIRITKIQTTKNGYYIQAESNDKFYIKIEGVKKNITNVAIRINTFGNKSYTELLYHKIDDNVSVVYYNQNGMPVKQGLQR